MRSTVRSVIVTLAMMIGSMLAFAGGKFLESRYVTHTAALTTSVDFEITNGASRVGLGSVFVCADAASNTWTILLINNNVTNILKTGTLTASANTLFYESSGGIPWGANGRIRITGTVNTNAALTSNIVFAGVHTQSAE